VDYVLETAETVAEDLFGIRASARQLPSERDQNFLLTAASDEKFVLKISNALEKRAFLEAQNSVLNHLAERISFCQRVIPASSGQSITEFRGHFVRLLNYLPGVPLAEIKPHRPGLLHELGRKLGQLTGALAGFDHPAVHRDFHWDLANGERVIREFGPLIADDALRRLVLNYRFICDGALRLSVIHGDPNDYNLLVDPETMTVSGLLDFGDMVYGYTVGDLAIALAYIVLDKPEAGAVFAEVIDGYTSEFPLQDGEREALWPLVHMRLCMSVCMAAYQQRQQPQNEYLSISQRAIAENLPRLLDTDLR